MERIEKMVPISIVGLDCYANSILTILNWKLGEFYLVFYDSWCFYYQKKKSLGDSIMNPLDKVWYNLKKYYNFSCYEIEREIAVEQIKDNLQSNMPIIICIDMFFCNWTNNYRVDHAEHVVIVNGYDSTKDCFCVMDTMPVKTNIEIESTELSAGLVWAQNVSFCKDTKRNANVRAYLYEKINRLERDNHFEQLGKFVGEITKERVEKELQDNRYIWSIPLIKNLKRWYGDRKQFLIALKGIDENDNSEINYYKIISEVFEEVVKQWGVIVNLLYKYKIMGCVKENEVIERFEKLILLEKATFREIKDIVESGRTEKVNEVFLEVDNIDIEYNFMSHFYGNEDFECVTELPKSFKIGEGLVRFYHNSKFNNCISCMGQEIAVNKKVKVLHFIGYSTWGNQIGEVKIRYEDEEEGIELRMSDWCLGETFCEKTLWKGKFVTQDSKKDVSTGYIYDAELRLNVNKCLETITLPQNKDIILFSVGMEYQL